MQYKASHSHPHGHVQVLAKILEKFDPFVCQGPLEPLGVGVTPRFVLKCSPNLPLARA